MDNDVLSFGQKTALMQYPENYFSEVKKVFTNKSVCGCCRQEYYFPHICPCTPVFKTEVIVEDKSSRAIKIVKVLMEKEIVKRDMNAGDLLNLLELLIQNI